MKKKLSIALIGALCVFLAAGNVFAASYASDLAVDKTAVDGMGDLPLEFSYRLNHAADSVDVIVYDDSTMTEVRTLSGGTARGVNNVYWDNNDDGGNPVPVGSYSFKVQVQSTDSATSITGTKWYQNCDPYSDSADQPYGSDVNKNPESEHFGHLYVVHQNDASPDDIALIYEYPSDVGVASGSGSDADAITSGASDLVVDWDDNGTVPRFIQVDEEGYLYVANWYGSGPNAMREIFRFDPDITNPQIVLGNSTNPEYSDVAKSCDVRGTGTDKTIWLMDTGTLSGEPIVWKWIDTNGDGTWTDENVATSFTLSAGDDPDGTVMSIDVDADGNCYISSDEAGTGENDVAKFAPDGTRIWATGAGTSPNLAFVRTVRVWDGANPEDTSDDVVIIDSTTGGSSSGLTILDADDGSVLATDQTWSAYQGFDVVGNAYNISQSGRYIKLSTLQGGITDYTTDFTGSISVNAVVPVELSVFSIE